MTADTRALMVLAVSVALGEQPLAMAAALDEGDGGDDPAGHHSEERQYEHGGEPDVERGARMLARRERTALAPARHLVVAGLRGLDHIELPPADITDGDLEGSAGRRDGNVGTRGGGDGATPVRPGVRRRRG